MNLIGLKIADGKPVYVALNHITHVMPYKFDNQAAKIHLSSGVTLVVGHTPEAIRSTLRRDDRVPAP